MSSTDGERQSTVVSLSTVSVVDCGCSADSEASLPERRRVLADIEQVFLGECVTFLKIPTTSRDLTMRVVDVTRGKEMCDKLATENGSYDFVT